MSADIIAFPAKAVRSCWDCVHLVSGSRGNYCLEFGESILDEVTAAADCPMYARDEGVTDVR